MKKFIFLFPIFFIISLILLFLIFHTKRIEKIDPKLNITVWGKSIFCKNFHAVINITGGVNNSYYLKSIKFISIVEGNEKIIDSKPLSVGDSIELDYNIKNFDEFPYGLMRLRFYDIFNKTYFDYYIKVDCI